MNASQLRINKRSTSSHIVIKTYRIKFKWLFINRSREVQRSSFDFYDKSFIVKCVFIKTAFKLNSTGQIVQDGGRCVSYRNPFFF